MRIRFVEFQELLKSRNGGKVAKEKFRPYLLDATATNPVVFDFEGVRSLSSSFADEFFGMLVNEMGFEEFKSITTFRGTDRFVANIIRAAIVKRNSKQLVAT
ncbi:STAS-like domain-containing protein [Brevibacillus borstelensis]|uniref:STAS-like domain-containing protein n=1 Tax=Brevibacillus borstelensis TaxID=45462 RepID=UPI001166AEF3|nr:STAS-like domain-containing protein [Brevibacillus borstelensis]MED1881261.1 STAS-like domain-containing protein [Brevibacillus borstelensis]GED55417.1 hypothetical protein BBO01nite_46580 [Brevibacillus borstelensis]